MTRSGNKCIVNGRVDWIFDENQRFYTHATCDDIPYRSICISLDCIVFHRQGDP